MKQECYISVDNCLLRIIIPTIFLANIDLTPALKLSKLIHSIYLSATNAHSVLLSQENLVIWGEEFVVGAQILI